MVVKHSILVEVEAALLAVYQDVSLVCWRGPVGSFWYGVNLGYCPVSVQMYMTRFDRVWELVCYVRPPKRSGLMRSSRLPDPVVLVSGRGDDHGASLVHWTETCWSTVTQRIHLMVSCHGRVFGCCYLGHRVDHPCSVGRTVPNGHGSTPECS